MTNIPTGSPTSGPAIPPQRSQEDSMQPQPITTAGESTAVNFQIFRDSDLIDRGHIVQQFLSQSRAKEGDSYYAALDLPVLVEPDVDGQRGPQPYGSAEKRAIKKKFSETLADAIGKRGLPAAEAKALFEAIMQSILGGSPKIFEKLPHPEMAKNILKEAVEETKKTCGLPPLWSPNSTAPSEWVPVGDVGAATIKTGKIYNEFFFSTSEQFLNNLEVAVKKVEDSIPSDNPNRAPIGDLIRIIASALRELKGMLRDSRMTDADKSFEASKAKLDSVKERDELLTATQQKREEDRIAREKAEKTAKIFRILGPIMSAVSFILAVVAVGTGGAAAPLAIAALVVSGAMLTYTVADAIVAEVKGTGITGMAIAALNEYLESKFPGDENKSMRMLVKVWVVAVIVVVLAAVIIASGGGAASSVATQIAQAAAKEMAKQMIIIVIMASNVLPEMIIDRLIAWGAIDKDDSTAKMVIQIVVSLVAILAMTKMMSGGSKAPAQDKAGPLDAPAKALTERMKDFIKELPAAVRQKFIDFAKGVKETFTIDPNKKVSDLAKFGSSLAKFSSLGTEATANILKGIEGMRLVKLLEEMGELGKADEMIQLLINLLQHILDSLQSDQEAGGEWLNTIQQGIDSTFRAGDQMVKRALQTRS